MEILGSARDFWVLLKSPSTRAEILGSGAAILGPRWRFWAPSSARSRELQKTCNNRNNPKLPKTTPLAASPGVEKKKILSGLMTSSPLPRVWVNFCRNRPPWQQGGRRGPKLSFLAPFWCRLGCFGAAAAGGRCGIAVGRSITNGIDYGQGR